MAKLAVQHLAIYTDENLPNSKKCQISLKILPITKLTFTKNCFTKSVVKRKEPGKSLQLISKLEKHNPSRKNYFFHFDCFYEKVAL